MEKVNIVFRFIIIFFAKKKTAKETEVKLQKYYVDSGLSYDMV